MNPRTCIVPRLHPWACLLLGLLAGFLWSTRDAVAATRFEPPLRDPLYFNQLLPRGGDGTWPVRFPRLGRHYAELILEPAGGVGDFALASPLSLELHFSFTRNGRPVGERVASVVLQPGERGKTLFFFEVPGDLPHRADLALQVRVSGAETAPDAVAFRLQLRRKLDFAPLPPWR